MSTGQLGVAALCGYLLALIGVAELARRARRDATPADHFLAGRELGVFVLFLTLYATAYSGNSLLGYPGEAFRRGFSWIMATGFMMAIIVVFHALVPRLRPIAVREHFVTPGDWLVHRFGGEPGGAALVVSAGVLMAIALANFLLAQLTAMGLVTHQITEGAVPYWAGVVGLAALILVYETLGGMRAVAWTDTAQGVLMLLGLAALLGWLLGEAGGLAALTADIAAQRPEAVALPDRLERTNWLSSILLLGLGSVVYPQAVQRIYAARSGRALRGALALMTFMPLATTLVVTLIGLAAIPRLAMGGGAEADRVMPQLLEAWAAAGPGSAALAVLVFIGALAAIMSTADSVLLSLGSLITSDVLGRQGRDAAATRFGKRAAAVVMLGAVVLALLPRLSLWRLIELKMELLIQCVPGFLLALHWGRMRARPTLAGLWIGTAVAAGGVLLGVKRVEGIHLGLIGLVANVLVAVVGSLAFPGARQASATAAPATEPRGGTGTPSASAR